MQVIIIVGAVSAVLVLGALAAFLIWYFARKLFADQKGTVIWSLPQKLAEN